MAPQTGTVSMLSAPDLPRSPIGSPQRARPGRLLLESIDQSPCPKAAFGKCSPSKVARQHKPPGTAPSASETQGLSLNDLEALQSGLDMSTPARKAHKGLTSALLFAAEDQRIRMTAATPEDVMERALDYESWYDYYPPLEEKPEDVLERALDYDSWYDYYSFEGEGMPEDVLERALDYDSWYDYYLFDIEAKPEDCLERALDYDSWYDYYPPAEAKADDILECALDYDSWYGYHFSVDEEKEILGKGPRCGRA